MLASGFALIVLSSRSKLIFGACCGRAEPMKLNYENLVFCVSHHPFIRRSAGAGRRESHPRATVGKDETTSRRVLSKTVAAIAWHGRAIPREHPIPHAKPAAHPFAGMKSDVAGKPRLWLGSPTSKNGKACEAWGRSNWKRPKTDKPPLNGATLFLVWVLDVTFGEDQSRARTGHAAENLSTLRRLVMNLLKKDTLKKRGIKAKQLNAAWDISYLSHLLGF